MQGLAAGAVIILSACNHDGGGSPGGGDTQPSGDNFTVGGNISGLIGSGLVLQNNGADNLAVSADGNFSFSAALADGSSYRVTVATQPGGQTCSVTNGTGTINGANITSVQVSCSVLTYTVGGTVAGLTGAGLVLQNNGGDNLAVSANGDFTFATALANGAGYSLSVATQPAGQNCSVANGAGTINGANVTNTQVNCGAALPPLWLSANNGVTGIELYGSDGTATGTTLIKNINANTATGSKPENLVVMNGVAYFTANDGMSGVELWKSDGTAAGTVRVKDINPGSAGGFPDTFYAKALTVVGNTLYFAANDGTSGYELWKSDGTDAGTVRVKNINPGAGLGSSPGYLTAVGSTLYFTANDGTSGYELWRSNGTEVGTVLVRDVDPGAIDSAPSSLIAIGTTVYFSACTTATGCELWKSDGTTDGTVLLLDITPGGNMDGAYHGFPQLLTAVGGTLYFTANNVPQTGNLIVANGTQLWKSDGTPTGTVMLKDLAPPAAGGGSYPSNLAAVGSTLYFNAFDAINGTELWKSDGTEAGTVMVKDINPGAGSSNVFGSALTPVGVAVGDTLYFSASDGASGYELWKSNGTDAGTVRVKNINPGAGLSSFPSFLTAVGGTLYFTANDGAMGVELWKSNGTDAGTINVIDLFTGSMNGVNSILKP